MAARDDSGLTLWYLVPVAMLVGVFAVGAVVVGTLRGSGDPAEKARAAEEVTRKLPAYWTVRKGQTFSYIAQRTGLSVDTLQDFNPRTDPASIVPGQRIKLRLHAAVRAAQAEGPGVLDRPIGAVLRFDRRRDRPQDRHAAAPQPAPEAGDAQAWRSGAAATLSRSRHDRGLATCCPAASSASRDHRRGSRPRGAPRPEPPRRGCPRRR